VWRGGGLRAPRPVHSSSSTLKKKKKKTRNLPPALLPKTPAQHSGPNNARTRLCVIVAASTREVAARISNDRAKEEQWLVIKRRPRLPPRHLSRNAGGWEDRTARSGRGSEGARISSWTGKAEGMRIPGSRLLFLESRPHSRCEDLPERKERTARREGGARRKKSRLRKRSSLQSCSRSVVLPPPPTLLRHPLVTPSSPPSRADGPTLEARRPVRRFISKGREGPLDSDSALLFAGSGFSRLFGDRRH
jgi:hypothetical protein